MNVRGLVVALVLALGAVTPASAQDAGATSATVLRFAPAPRALALGGAYAALADELSVFYNPARLAAASPAAGLSYRTLPVDAGVGSAVLALRLGPGTLGGGVQFLNYGEIEVVEPDPTSGGEQGIATGERVGGGELAATIAYGLRLFGRVQLGAAAKLLRLQIAEASAAGAAFDVGVGADLLGGRLMLGAAVQNLGAELGPARSSPLPRLTRVGAALRLDGPGGVRTTFVAEALEFGGTMTPAGGIELGVAATGGASLVGRVGYDGGDGRVGSEPLVAGVGIGVDGFDLDYAYRVLGPLGAAHVFGISFRLGSPD